MSTIIDAHSDDIDTPSWEYASMYERHWRRIHDLLNGTQGMRQAGRRWLPQEPREKNDAYDRRLLRSYLFPGFSRAVRQIVSKPFGRPTTIHGDLPERLEVLKWDVDGEGTDITQFARDVFESALIYGKTHIFVDYANVGANANLAQQQSARPYFVHVRPPQLFGWNLDNGELSEIRWREVRTRTRDGAVFATAREHLIRRYTRDSFSVWVCPDLENWSERDPVDFFQSEELVKRRTFERTDQGDFRFPGRRIPMVTVYFNRVSPMVSVPPLDDLAWTNIQLWQAASDQSNILRHARVPQKFAKGVSAEEVEDMSVQSAGGLWFSQNENASIDIIEQAGSAVDAGRQDIRDILEMMEMLGSAPFASRQTDMTATGIATNEGRATSDVLAWIESAEMGLSSAFDIAHEWVGSEMSDDFSVNIFSDFTVGMRGSEDVSNLREARRDKDISRKVYLRELQRRGVISENFTVEDIIEQLEEEGERDMESLVAAIREGGGRVDEPDVAE